MKSRLPVWKRIIRGFLWITIILLFCGLYSWYLIYSKQYVISRPEVYFVCIIGIIIIAILILRIFSCFRSLRSPTYYQSKGVNLCQVIRCLCRQHEWEGCRCTVCGNTRHKWKNSICQVCHEKCGHPLWVNLETIDYGEMTYSSTGGCVPHFYVYLVQCGECGELRKNWDGEFYGGPGESVEDYLVITDEEKERYSSQDP